MRDFGVRINTIVMISVMLPLLAGCLDSTGDNGASATLNPTPAGGNRAPVISGTPGPSVKTGEPYSFTPSASDPDGDTLTYSIQNKPLWAEFNSSTGQLSGTPQSGSEGTYSNIVLSVSDGQLAVSLSAFSVSVNQTGTGSATLTWTPPTRNSDGSVLTDLAGYTIYYGNAPGNYQTSIRINNPGIATYVVPDLTQGTYYFVSTAFNSNGVPSAFSNEAVKVVN